MNDKKLVIALNGPPGSGKDFIADYINSNFEFIKTSFKDIAFLKVIEHYNISESLYFENYNDRQKKETPLKELNYLTPREAIIHVCENIIKAEQGRGALAKGLVDNILKTPYSFFVISDLGFDEELEELIKCKDILLYVIKIEREGCAFGDFGDTRKYVEKIDYILTNNITNIYIDINTVVTQILNNVRNANFRKDLNG